MTWHRAWIVAVGSLLLASGACGGDDFRSGEDTSSEGAGASTGSGAVGGGASGSGGGDAGAQGGAGPGPCAAGESCIEKPPLWTGPVAAFLGPEDPPGCGAGWEVDLDVFAGSVNGDVTCSACVCGGATGAGCGVPPLTVYSDTGCDNQSATVTLTSNTCKAMPAGSKNVNRGPVTMFPGQCPASGGDATLGDPIWELNARLCAPSEARSCEGGACASAPDPAFGWPCVYREGDHTCPQGFTARTTLHQTFADTRGCSECDCSTPTGGVCQQGTVYLYPSSCNVSGVSAIMAPNCSISVSTTGFAYAKYVPGSVTPGTCSPSGGQPQGKLEAANQVTLCCSE